MRSLLFLIISVFCTISSQAADTTPTDSPQSEAEFVQLASAAVSCNNQGSMTCFGKYVGDSCPGIQTYCMPSGRKDMFGKYACYCE